MTYLAVPIAAQNPDLAGQLIKTAISSGAEMLELRTDYLENLNIEMVRKLVAQAKETGNKKLRIIVTCRDKKQGGARAYSEQLRVDILAAAREDRGRFYRFRIRKLFHNRKSGKTESRTITEPKGTADSFDTQFRNQIPKYSKTLPAYPNTLAGSDTQIGLYSQSYQRLFRRLRPTA